MIKVSLRRIMPETSFLICVVTRWPDSPSLPQQHHGPGHPCACRCSAQTWMQSLQLFHYFNTHVSRALRRNPATEDLYTKAVPDAAVDHVGTPDQYQSIYLVS